VTRQARPARGRQQSLPGLLALPVTLLIFGALLVVFVSPVISWALGEGTPGVFTARSYDCRHGCHWSGEFTSSGGALTVPHVTLASLGRPGTMHAGATIPVMRISSVLSESTVYPRHPELRDLRSSAIWPFLALALVVLLALVRSIWVIPGRRRRLPGVPGSGGRNS
jgi:hypothetical protein